MVATRLKYNLASGTHYLDLARDLSMHHRKLHRQKKIYTVYGGFIRNNQGTSAKFNTAPLTWTAKAAVNRSFKIWRRMISETLKDKPGLTTGKWNDFKIYLDNQHGSPAPARDAAGNSLSAGEWDYSTFTQPRLVDPDGDGGLEFDGNADQWEVMITGPTVSASPTNHTRVGLIQSWYDSRQQPDGSGQPTNIPNALDPLSNMFRVTDDNEEKVSIIEDEGDQPPYHRNQPYGILPGALAPAAIADNDASSNVTALGSQVVGFQALCGLVQVVVNTSGTCELFIDVESEGESF